LLLTGMNNVGGGDTQGGKWLLIVVVASIIAAYTRSREADTATEASAASRSTGAAQASFEAQRPQAQHAPDPSAPEQALPLALRPVGYRAATAASSPGR
jgi:hypothetical protein